MPISTFKSVFLFMKFIQGKPRNQWEMYCLDKHVDADNAVRLIDLFVDSLNLNLKLKKNENQKLTVLKPLLLFKLATVE